VATDTEQLEFPSPPIAATRLLVPICSWAEMFEETRITAVTFDLFWFESVMDRVAYFFRWLGEPRSTIFVVWNYRELTHIECRKLGDVHASETESMPMVAEMKFAFRIRTNPDNSTIDGQCTYAPSLLELQSIALA
jgi:hypothetical protein